jgi:putative cell wall-binding protein
VSSATKGLRRAGIGGLTALVAAALAGTLAASPANAEWSDPTGGANNTGGQIGIVDKTVAASPGTAQAPLVYPGQDNQALADVQLVLPNKWEAGDTIRLTLFDRSAGSTWGQINADGAHGVSFSGAPTVTVNPAAYRPATDVGSAAGQSQNNPVRDLNPGGQGIPTTAPTFDTKVISSSRESTTTSIIELKATNQSDGWRPTDKWIVTLSGLKVNLGASATPGELRLVPFSYSGAPTASLDNASLTFGNLDASTLSAILVTQYTVPAYVAPVTLDVASPSSLQADQATHVMGDLTIAETNTYSLTTDSATKDATYRVTLKGNVTIKNDDTGDPIKLSLEDAAFNEKVAPEVAPGDIGTTVGGDDYFEFTLHQGNRNAATQFPGKLLKIKVSGLELASDGPLNPVPLPTGNEVGAPFTYEVSGGSIGDGADGSATSLAPNAFMVDADTSDAIPDDYTGNGKDREGVETDDNFLGIVPVGSPLGTLLGCPPGGCTSDADLGGMGLAQANPVFGPSQKITAPPVVFAGQTVSVNERVGGADRYGTAAKIALSAAGCASTCSAAGFPSHLRQDIVIASGEDFPDALSSDYLATSLGTSVLLTRSGSLPQATKTAIQQLGVNHVYIVGGTNAVSQAVENALANMDQTYTGGDTAFGQGKIDVDRISGADRYLTNQKVNEYASANSVWSEPVGRTNITFGVDTKRTALVATGQNFPDALAAGAAVSSAALTQAGGPIPLILTRGDSLISSASAQISDLGIQQTVIVGGSDVVSDAVASSLGSAGTAVKRVFGADRYATAVALADFMVAPWASTASREGGLGVDDGFTIPATTDHCVVSGAAPDCQWALLATGESFADALAGGPLAASLEFLGGQGAPILLTRQGALPDVTKAWLEAHRSTYSRVLALGLGAAVSDAVLTAANQAIS